MTYQEKLIIGLRLFGCQAVRSTSKKYLAFSHPSFKSGNLFFVGKAGALRKGPTATQSFSLGDPSNQTSIYRRLLEAERTGVAKACLNCVHLTDQVPPTHVPSEQDKMSGYRHWCIKLGTVTAPFALRCGGDDFTARS